MDTGEWLDQWLESKTVTPRTLEKYSSAITQLKETIAFKDIRNLSPELVEKATGGNPGLHSVLSMALGQAVTDGLISKNIAAIKREQRKPQEGSLFYRENRKAWVALVTVTDENGKRIQRTRQIKVDRKTKNPPDAAIKALEELKAMKSDGGMSKGVLTIAEMMEEWLASIRIKRDPRGKGIAVRTFEQYESISRIHIVPALGKINVRDLKRRNVDRWLGNLEGSIYVRENGTSVAFSANTLRLCRVVLAMALQWAISEGIVPSNVARESKPPGGKPRPEKHALSEEQTRQLFRSTRESDLGPLWALMVTTGLRRGEALGLRWKDYDGESITLTNQIKIEAGQTVRGDLKTDKSKRRIRLPQFLIRDLDAHKKRQIDQTSQVSKTTPELMFPDSYGGYIRPDDLR